MKTLEEVYQEILHSPEFAETPKGYEEKRLEEIKRAVYNIHKFIYGKNIPILPSTVEAMLDILKTLLPSNYSIMTWGEIMGVLSSPVDVLRHVNYPSTLGEISYNRIVEFGENWYTQTAFQLWEKLYHWGSKFEQFKQEKFDLTKALELLYDVYLKLQHCTIK